ncbi:hypothetical protein Tco_0868195 [Tanacetum coccineum]
MRIPVSFVEELEGSMKDRLYLLMLLTYQPYHQATLLTLNPVEDKEDPEGGSEDEEAGGEERPNFGRTFAVPTVVLSTQLRIQRAFVTDKLLHHPPLHTISSCLLRPNPV